MTLTLEAEAEQLGVLGIVLGHQDPSRHVGQPAPPTVTSASMRPLCMAPREEPVKATTTASPHPATASHGAFITPTQPRAHGVGMDHPHDTHAPQEPQPESPRRARPGRNLRRTALVIALGVPAVVAVGGVARASLATDEPEPAVVNHDYMVLDPGHSFDPAWEDDLVARFDELGIEYDLRTNVCGQREIGFDLADPEAFDAFDELVAERTPVSPEQVAENHRTTDAFAAFLDERGIPYRVQTEASGIRSLHPDGDASGFVDAQNEFLASIGPSDDLAATNAAISTEQDALAAFLDERGIPYTREVVDDPVFGSYVNLSYDDETQQSDQLAAALEDFYTQPGTPWCGTWPRP
jgi:hypothetical protein